jgi:hypothetical protein
MLPDIASATVLCDGVSTATNIHLLRPAIPELPYKSRLLVYGIISCQIPSTLAGIPVASELYHGRSMVRPAVPRDQVEKLPAWHDEFTADWQEVMVSDVIGEA